MFQKTIQTVLSLLVVVSLGFTSVVPAVASDSDSSSVSDAVDSAMSTDDDEDEDEVTVDEDDEPYICFGEDLTSSQKQTVLSLMGISDFDEDDYTVSYVTNEEEHEYLDDYLDSSTIGTKALSSVLIVAADEGDGITVTTKNITYCTEGMYENALATAGLDDVDVIVAGPFEISGTAALIGAAKAYSEMTGEDVDEDLVDAAIEEIVTTGALEDELSDEDASSLESMIAELKEGVASGEISSDEIKSAIEEAAEEYNLSLTDDQIAQIQALLEKLAGLDLNIDSLVSQAKNIANSLGDLVDSDDAKGVFQKIINFFSSILEKLGF